MRLRGFSTTCHYVRKAGGKVHDVMPHLEILKSEKNRHACVSLCYVKRGLGGAHQVVYFGYWWGR